MDLKKWVLSKRVIMFLVSTLFLIVVSLVLFGGTSANVSVLETINYSNEGFKVEVIAQDLEVPWEIVFAPDGRIFFTERPGRLRVIENGTLRETPVKNFSVYGDDGEGGLLGLALDPNFERNRYMYIYYTYSNESANNARLVRYKEDNNSLSNETIIIDNIPAAVYHDGGRIKFGPDGKLYVTTGDATMQAISQNLSSLGGKFLRINSDGSIPSDNPFPNSTVYSYGHRNSQGFDWHPDNNSLLVATEHGPSGGYPEGAQDEINIIEKGGNYGWPNVTCDFENSIFENSSYCTGRDTWAPSGGVFYNSDNIPSWRNKFFVAKLGGLAGRSKGLEMLNFDPASKSLTLNRTFLSSLGGGKRFRTVSMGPDGNLYILTSERDGRGSSRGNNYDKILRIVHINHSSIADGEWSD